MISTAVEPQSARTPRAQFTVQIRQRAGSAGIASAAIAPRGSSDLLRLCEGPCVNQEMTTMFKRVIASLSIAGLLCASASFASALEPFKTLRGATNANGTIFVGGIGFT